MNTHPVRFDWRGFTSVLIALGFAMLALSGIVLFLAPPGRVANWTNWTLLGLRKGDWSGLHIWFGTVFLAMTALHLVFNWRPLTGYFKSHARRTFALRREWGAALVLALGVFAGTRAGMVPFSTLLDWSEHWKESWDRPAERAPLPHAELLTLAALAEKAGVEATTAMSRLEARGFRGFTVDTTVQVIAERGRIAAREVFEIIGGAAHAPGSAEGKLGGGPGWKTLAAVCLEEGIPLADARARLQAKSIAFDERQTLREIATANGLKPYALLETIRAR